MKKNLSVVLLSLLCAQTFAMKKSHTTHLYEAEFRDFGQIGIKRILRDDLSRSELAQWSINTVEVRAKSIDDQGQLKLVSGRGELESRSLVGNADSYHTRNTGFSYTNFFVPSHAKGDGALKLITLGDIKIDSITVGLEATPSYDFRNTSQLHFTDETSFKVSKVVGSSETIRVNGPVDGIRLVGEKEKVSVTSVTLHFADGERIELTELDGRLKPGQAVAFRLAHELDKPLDKIVVSGVSSGLIGSRGKIRVQLGHK
ncbi:hypothetical protein [Bacteriovorax sp. Seq25_V]|uniref:hypothetical protein n=1 Tax=Bacteriovorax sp. Seq25_V TaxID=1201288 RepID=UPI00038A2F40|nr:hypothetical protein [Bacteriovorax sp. Seq25_V]EQC45568.1 hypothetical protein M900_1898 [Bacteriovorax sp. Seq25_V]